MLKISRSKKTNINKRNDSMKIKRKYYNSNGVNN